MNKYIKYIIGLVVIIFIGILINKNNTVDTSVSLIEKNEPIKIGHIGIFTGPVAGFGEILYEGIQLAVADVNEVGGINGQELEVLVEDYAYDTKQAIPAYEILKGKGVDYFFADGSNGVSILAPLFVKDKKINIASSAATPVYFDDNALTCRISLTADKYATKMIEEVSKNFGTNAKIAFLVVSNTYGEGMIDSITTEAEKIGMTVTMTEQFEGSSNDFRTQITRLKSRSQNIDTLIVVNSGSSANSLFKQLRQLNFEKDILADNWTILNPAFESREDLEGVTFIDYEFSLEDSRNQNRKTDDFVDRYFKRFGRNPNTIAVNAYDTIMLYAKAIAETNNGGPEAVADYFVNKMGSFDGVGGSISFDNDCEVVRKRVTRTIAAGQVSGA